MGTNYYVYKETSTCGDACEHCTEIAIERVHLGKSSMGWKFGFYAPPHWPREKALDYWLDQTIDGERIEDEYGHEVSRDQLLALIMRKQDKMSHLVDHGPTITGPHFKMFADRHWDCKGFDFSDSEFS